MCAPSLAQIRRIFGGNWSSATAALPRVAASDVLAHRLLARATFTDPDCVAALRRWHAETGARLEAAYCDWARAQRDGGSDVPSRIPASGDVFRRRFGSWALALQAAGIQCQRAAVTRRPFTPRQARHATREEIVVGLRQAYAAIGEPFSVTRYDAWVRQQAIEHAERLETFRIPGHRAAVPIFGSWGQAVAEALGDDRSAVAAVERRVRSFSDRELAAAWWACRRELKCVPSSGEYERWRHAEAERTGFREWPPCEGSIRTRLGDRRWGLACDRLQAAGEPDA